MTDITVRQLANVVGISSKDLLKKLGEAGVEITDPDAMVSDAQKQTLLAYIQKEPAEGAEVAPKKKITLKSKRKAAGTLSRDAIVTTRVRKRTYVSAAEEEAEEPAVEAALEQDSEAGPVDQTDTAETHAEPATKKPAKKKTLTQAPPPPPPSTQRRRRKGAAKRGGERDERDDRGDVRRRGKKRRIDPQQVTSLDQKFEKPVAPVVHEVWIPESIKVSDLAQQMSVKAAEVIKVMMNMGAMATINQVIDQETATIIVEEMGHTPKLLKEDAVETQLALDHDDTSDAEPAPRPPVVTIMGHVDHGKTTLLDYIRSTKVTSGEAGGITQHIGAYHVKTDRGQITFLDTPGHEAFTAMRARGAKCTDIVVLVVAADDGVMPQTVEAIQHARAAEAPIIVAVNKIDKEGADPERVKTELAKHELMSEEWGGDVIFQHISAKTGEGVDSLLESILLQAELMELKAVAEGSAWGAVVESRLDRGRGPVATVLVQKGQLHKGDILIAGREYGRVRMLIDSTGTKVPQAGPSFPVEVLGLSGMPAAGDEVVVVGSERKAREVVLFRQGKYRDVRLARGMTRLEDIFDQVGKGKVSALNVVLKADTNGSMEAISDSLLKLSTDEVRVSIVASGVGGINASDVNLALASQALILGFNVRADAMSKQMAENDGIEIRYYSVIYNLIDQIKSALSGMLAPGYEEKILGLAEVRSVFRSSKIGAIAGCMVLEGTIKRNSAIRVLRDDVVVYQGELESLRRFKEAVNEVRNGTECGIGVKDYNDVKEGDRIEVYETIEVQRSL